MKKFIQAIKDVDLPSVKAMIERDPELIDWTQPDGKNALHFLGGVVISKKPAREADSLAILKLLLKKGMDMNAVHRIVDKGCGFFPATPLWYSYTRGRNETLYKYLLSRGADPQNCMFAIAWYDDTDAAALFIKHGADINQMAGDSTPFLGAFNWKRFAVAEWFLKNGADVNAADEKGNTALYYAVAQRGKYDAGQIKMLMRYGADPDRENAQGISPRKRAELDRRRSLLGLFG